LKSPYLNDKGFFCAYILRKIGVELQIRALINLLTSKFN
jgi:hypothetical protein